MQSTQDSINEMKQSIDGMKEFLGKKFDTLGEILTPPRTDKSGNPNFDNEPDEELARDIKFHSRRNRALPIATFILGAFSLAMYKWCLPLFSIPFGFFITMVMVCFLVLFFDPYILPGDTIKRISKNGLASAIVWVAFVLALFSGVSIGNSLISARGTGEEHNQPTSQKIGIEQPAVPATNGQQSEK